MNKRFVLFHLKEALEELQRTVKEVEQDTSYDVEGLQVGMGHLYHHLNTAWNGKDCTDEEFKECSDEKFPGGENSRRSQNFILIELLGQRRRCEIFVASVSNHEQAP